eukprot:TRINITY_DN50245_c0_g1_i1.p1 TRINITY_DN50245_c0_g1~~TRINITY_DN50245_c0_g1_i1.p1  ORF type:complete len:108 (-),score=21.63 TRINITY_DN50245_c0_g1_i1:69-392(-)
MGFRLLHPVHASHLEYCSGTRSTDIYFASSAIVWDTDTKEFSGGYLNIAIVDGYKKERDVLDFKPQGQRAYAADFSMTVSYTHLRAHETPEHLVCRLLLEKKIPQTQ